MIKDRILQVRENIARICQSIGKNPADITLVGVTKYSSVEQTREAIEAGITDIGELKVQDAREKFLALGEQAERVTRHMIGHLQTNKVKVALKIFDIIQTVDSEKLAAEIEKHAAAGNHKAKILIEVNCSGEAQKSGIARDQALSLVEKISFCEHLHCLGLMTMASFVEDEAIVRRGFRDLRQLGELIKKNFSGHPRVQMVYLSMGMSGDYEIALEEGSNMVRIGTAIFGHTN
jgi:PLP dependent protein